MKKKLLVVIYFGFIHLVVAQLPKFEWAKRIGGYENFVNDGPQIAVGKDGSIYSLGQFFKTEDFDPDTSVFNLTPVGGTDIYICKLNNKGAFVWSKQLGGVSFDHNTSIVLNEMGAILITGTFISKVDFDPGPNVYTKTSNGSLDAFVLNLNSDGEFNWVKCFGGMGKDYINALALDTFKNMYLTGSFEGQVDFDPDSITEYLMSSIGVSDVSVVKLDADGNFIWAKQIGGLSATAATSSILVNTEDEICLAGWFSGAVDFNPGNAILKIVSLGEYDAFIVKLDLLGRMMWAKNFSGLKSEFIYSIACDLNGGVYATGTFQSDCDFDPDAGEYNLNAYGNQDLFLFRLNPRGSLIWAKQIGGLYQTYGKSMQSDQYGDVYVGGLFGDLTDFDPGPKVFNLSPNNGWDMFVMKFNTSGIFNWAINTGASYCLAHSIVLDDSGCIYTTGSFDGVVDFDFSNDVYQLNSGNSWALYISKMTQLETNLSLKNIIKPRIKLIPNPVTEMLLVEIDETIQSIEVMDILGQKFQLNILKQIDNIWVLDFSALAKGIYMVGAQSKGRVVVQKVIKV